MLNPTDPQATAAGSSSYSFLSGILVGQCSICLLCALFIRFVVFEDGNKLASPISATKKRRPSHSARLGSTPPPAIPPSAILTKTNYDLSTHGSESTDWLNVLFAQTLANYRSSLLAHKGEEGAREVVEEWLNPGDGVSWLDPIEVTSLSLGNSYPLFSGAKIRPSDSSGRMRAEIDLDYADSLTLGISTSLIVNFPRPRFAVLPISLGVTLVGLSGTVTTELLSSPTTDASPTPHQSIQLSLHPDFSLTINTTSLLGSRAKLQDLPKIEQLVASRLRQALVERVVYPRFVAVGLPGLGIGETVQRQREGGEKEDEFVLIEKEEADDGLGGLGEKLMKGVLPPPMGGGVLRMMEQEGVLKEMRKRSLEHPPVPPVASNVKESSRVTGLGGGLQSMPGGSDVDWSRGRDR